MVIILGEMKFVGVFSTSNGRPLDRHARIYRQNTPQPCHTSQHSCCSSGNLREEDLETRVKNILPIKIATYPGLNLKNIRSKKCYAGPYENCTVPEFLSEICMDAEFSGVIACIMLCNDDRHIGKDAKVEVKVHDYFTQLSSIFNTVKGIENAQLLIISTALYRQWDLHRDQRAYLPKKIEFNSALVEMVEKNMVKLEVAGRFIPCKIVDMRGVQDIEKMAQKSDIENYFCKNERQGQKIHLRGQLIDQFLIKTKTHYKAYTKSIRRSRPHNPFFYFCKMYDAMID